MIAKQGKAFLMAAGLGTRLRPITNTIPKCLVPILNRPLLDYWIDELVRAGIFSIGLNTHWHREAVSDYIYQVNQRDGVHLTEFYEPELLGSAGTVSATKSFVSDADYVVLIYADNFSMLNLQDMINYHHGHNLPISMMVFESDNPSACGIVECDDTQTIIGFEEKPRVPKSNLANAGVYVLDRKIYETIADMNVFDLGHDAFPKFISQMKAWQTTGFHQDIGTLQTYKAVQQNADKYLSKKGYLLDAHRKAIFLDRDGTLIEPVHYIKNPQDVRLKTGISKPLKQLQQMGYAIVVVTNQSGIGRKLLTESDYKSVNLEMKNQLARQGVCIDAVYFSDAVPVSKNRTVVENYYRKPGAGLLHTAAEQLKLQLDESWMIGDMISDVLAGQNANCKGCFGVHMQSEFDVSLLHSSSLILPTTVAALEHIIQYEKGN